MKNIVHKKRTQRVRRKLKKVSTDRYRLAVFRSSRNISAQIIDDLNNKTLITATSDQKNKESKKKKK